MLHLTMETLADHPYHLERVDYILILQLTMVSWNFSYIMALRIVSDHVESILMYHLTMETPTDHLQNTRVDYGQSGLFGTGGY